MDDDTKAAIAAQAVTSITKTNPTYNAPPEFDDDNNVFDIVKDLEDLAAFEGYTLENESNIYNTVDLDQNDVISDPTHPSDMYLDLNSNDAPHLNLEDAYRLSSTDGDGLGDVIADLDVFADLLFEGGRDHGLTEDEWYQRRNHECLPELLQSLPYEALGAEAENNNISFEEFSMFYEQLKSNSKDLGLI